MPDASTLSVVGSTLVALVALIVNAAGRRGDRKHAAGLAFEARVAEAKSAALLQLIANCQRIIDAVESGDDSIGMARMQFRVFREFYRLVFRIDSPELIAYGSRDVNAAVSDLQQVMGRTQRTEAAFQVLGVERCQKDKEDAILKGDFDGAADYHFKQRELEAAIGAKSGVCVDEVMRLCQGLLEQARSDLRGMQQG